MINKILLSSDGSNTAWKAVTYAADLAKQTGAAVTVLGVAAVLGSVTYGVIQKRL